MTEPQVAVLMCTITGGVAFLAGTLVSVFGFGPQETRYQRVACLYSQATAAFALAILIYLLSGGRP